MELIEHKKCTGCTACANSCPNNCIKMLPDEEGFLYPHIDDSKCIECGVCKDICPIDKMEKKLPIKTYALKNKNDEQ